MSDVRILRLLEYTGDLEELKHHLKGRGVQGQLRLDKYDSNSSIVIREYFLGDSIEIWDKLELTAKVILTEDDL